MKLALGRFCLSATALFALVLTGYSEGRAADPVSTAPAQVAAALHVQQWSQILWGLVTTQTGTETPSFGEPVFNPDGSITQSFTTVDGTEVILTAFPDGSAHLAIALPDGTTQAVSQSVPIFDGVSTTTIQWSLTSSGGLSVDYVSTVDDRGTIFDISDDITRLTGSSILPGGITQSFSVLAAFGLTEVESVQSDGSTFTLSVPLASPDFMHPDFSQTATGTYSGPGFSVDFMLTSTPKYPWRWAALLSDLDGGATGTFSLNGDFSGFGQLAESGVWGEALVALLSWAQFGETDLYLLTGENRYTGPAGASVDYLTHRWQTLTALLAPSPGLSSAGDRPDRSRTPPRLRDGRSSLPRTSGGVMRRSPGAAAPYTPGQSLPRTGVLTDRGGFGRAR